MCQSLEKWVRRALASRACLLLRHVDQIDFVSRRSARRSGRHPETHREVAGHAVRTRQTRIPTLDSKRQTLEWDRAVRTERQASVPDGASHIELPRIGEIHVSADRIAVLRQ